ncbi:MAG: hypothetical protein K0S43_910 [Cellulosimicrobium sp.]|jgi:hypothetical protein|nr:hypothetical protein [Cellulosimicrobium sp.]
MDHGGRVRPFSEPDATVGPVHGGRGLIHAVPRTRFT